MTIQSKDNGTDPLTDSDASHLLESSLEQYVDKNCLQVTEADLSGRYLFLSAIEYGELNCVYVIGPDRSCQKFYRPRVLADGLLDLQAIEEQFLSIRNKRSPSPTEIDILDLTSDEPWIQLLLDCQQRRIDECARVLCELAQATTTKSDADFLSQRMSNAVNVRFVKDCLAVARFLSRTAMAGVPPDGWRDQFLCTDSDILGLRNLLQALHSVPFLGRLVIDQNHPHRPSVRCTQDLIYVVPIPSLDHPLADSLRTALERIQRGDSTYDALAAVWNVSRSTIKRMCAISAGSLHESNLRWMPHALDKIPSRYFISTPEQISGLEYFHLQTPVQISSLLPSIESQFSTAQGYADFNRFCSLIHKDSSLNHHRWLHSLYEFNQRIAPANSQSIHSFYGSPTMTELLQMMRAWNHLFDVVQRRFLAMADSQHGNKWTSLFHEPQYCHGYQFKCLSTERDLLAIDTSLDHCVACRYGHQHVVLMTHWCEHVHTMLLLELDFSQRKPMLILDIDTEVEIFDCSNDVRSAIESWLKKLNSGPAPLQAWEIYLASPEDGHYQDINDLSLIQLDSYINGESEARLLQRSISPRDGRGHGPKALKEALSRYKTWPGLIGQKFQDKDISLKT